MMTNLRNTLQRLTTKSQLTDTFCSTIGEWLDTGAVDAQNYPESHHEAIFSQADIGWRQVFLGRISQGWENLQGHTTTNQGRTRPPYLWAASVVETLLRQSIHLWEQRNQEVHGHNAQEQAHLTRLRHQRTIQKLLDMKEKCIPSHRFAFPDNPQELLDLPTQTLENWILTRRHFILQSVKDARNKTADENYSILKWFPPAKDTRIQQHQAWKQDRLLYDPYSKKKRHKTTTQTTLTQFVTILTPP